MFYLLKNAWKYTREDRWRVVTFYILHTISYGGELLQPYAFGRAIDALQVNGIVNLFPTVQWVGLYVVGFFIFQIFHHTARYFEWTTAFGNQKRFINDMYQRLYSLPLKWHVEHHSGEIVNRMNVAGLALRDFGFSQYKYLGNLLLSLGPVVVLMTISWQISLICMVLTLVNLFVVQKMNKAIQPILHHQNESYHAYAARLVDFIGNIKTIITLRLADRTGRELEQKFENYYQANMQEFWINQPRCFISAFGAILTEIIIILYYVWNCRSTGQMIMIGTLMVIVNYFLKMRDAFFEIINNFYQTLHWKAALQAVNPILEGWSGEAELLAEKQLKPWQNVQVQPLRFKYKTGEKGIDLGLKFHSNSKIAIVGLSGSGKTTLLHVLAGLYDPDEIELIIDGRKHSSLKPLVYSAILFSQDVEIFENTILYNITFGLEVEPDELAKVIKAAQLQQVLARLPKGLETDVREKGVNLSGGEKQRLALARGLFFAKYKRILLLDEVSSNLDAHNERKIFQQILQEYQDKCVFCTIHRLHLLDMFEQVLVMDEGRIVQSGTFAELVRQEGQLQELWKKYLIQKA